MELALKNGDYVPDGKGEFLTLSGAEETLQRALIRLSVKQGALPGALGIGSRLHRLHTAPPAGRQGRASAWAAEARHDAEDIALRQVGLSQDGDALRLHVRLVSGNLSAEVLL